MEADHREQRTATRQWHGVDIDDSADPSRYAEISGLTGGFRTIAAAPPNTFANIAKIFENRPRPLRGAAAPYPPSHTHSPPSPTRYLQTSRHQVKHLRQVLNDVKWHLRKQRENDYRLRVLQRQTRSDNSTPNFSPDDDPSVGFDPGMEWVCRLHRLPTATPKTSRDAQPRRESIHCAAMARGRQATVKGRCRAPVHYGGRTGLTSSTSFRTAVDFRDAGSALRRYVRGCAARTASAPRRSRIARQEKGPSPRRRGRAAAGPTSRGRGASDPLDKTRLRSSISTKLASLGVALDFLDRIALNQLRLNRREIPLPVDQPPDCKPGLLQHSETGRYRYS